MLKGTEKDLAKKILNDICKTEVKGSNGSTSEEIDHEAIRELTPTWNLITKHLIEHITANASITGSTVTQVGTQPLMNGKLS